MKKVAILLSTYNGEKFIKEQLDSILNQTYKNISIYVRDDGSSDGTKKILQQYKDSVNIILGKNVGVTLSFKALLKRCSKADYYSFCDQDDVWYPNKIELAVKKLSNLDDEKPLLYAANFDFYDENMNFLFKSGYKNKNISFPNSLFETVSPGMTMVINNKTRELLLDSLKDKCGLHDEWAYKICAGLGEVIYDDTVVVKYRRHSKSVTTTKLSLIEKIKFQISYFFNHKHWDNVRKQLNSFDETYGHLLRKEDIKLLKLFTRKRNILTQLKKFFYRRRFKASMVSELKIRLMFFLGFI